MLTRLAIHRLDDRRHTHAVFRYCVSLSSVPYIEAVENRMGCVVRGT